VSDLPRCKLCGTGTSGCDNPRFEKYTKQLIDSATVARDERSLVFVAMDNLSKLDSLGGSNRVLPHEEGTKIGHIAMFSRYAHTDDAKENIEVAIKCLNLALDSINKHINK